MIICKELVNLLGGNIHVQSAVGEGTVIKFSSIFEKFEKKENVHTYSTFQMY